ARAAPRDGASDPRPGRARIHRHGPGDGADDDTGARAGDLRRADARAGPHARARAGAGGRGTASGAPAARAGARPQRAAARPAPSERQLAWAHAHAVSRRYPWVAPLATGLLALHIRNIPQSEIMSAAERSGGRLPGSREVAVCFAALVGFTRLGEEVPPDELS